MIRLLRRVAAWVVVKTGPVMMVVSCTCGSCGRRFQAVYEDIGPIIQKAAAASKPLLTAEVQSPKMLPKIGGDDAFRN